MNWIIVTLLALFSIIGGVYGWWKGTRDLASPPERYDRPIGIGRREYDHLIITRYRRRRILWTVGGAVGGAAGGFALLLIAAIRRWFG